MKKLAGIAFVLLVFLMCNGFSKAETSNQKIIKNGKKQQSVLEELKTEMKNSNLSLDDLRDSGDYYFSQDGGIVIQTKDSSNIPIVAEKLKRNSDKLNGIFKNLKKKLPDQVENIKVNYSYNELVDRQNAFKEYVKDFNLSKQYKIDLDEENNELNLTINELSKKDEVKLKEIYGDMLKISIDPNFSFENVRRLASKGRKEDWNSIGGGIGIKYRFYESANVLKGGVCTVAGVAHKNGKMWAITAGHCLEHLDSPIYQWDSTLGIVHLDAFPSDYDFGLIEINGSGITRYASNGLYEYNGSTTTGYDRSYYGTVSPSLNLAVCKSGVTTGKTCGYIKTVRTVGGTFNDGEVYTTVKSNGGGNLVWDGDSGAPWYTETIDGKILLVGITATGSTNSQGVVDTATFCPFNEVAQKYGIYLYTSTTKTQIN